MDDDGGECGAMGGILVRRNLLGAGLSTKIII
jgi:hypothetical protein